MAKIHTNKTFTLQKRAVRIITGSTFTAHTEPLFQEFSILKFDDLYKLFLGIYMYKQENQLCSQPLMRDIPLNAVIFTVIIHAIAMNHANLKYIANCLLIVVTIALLIIGL